MLSGQDSTKLERITVRIRMAKPQMQLRRNGHRQEGRDGTRTILPTVTASSHHATAVEIAGWIPEGIFGLTEVTLQGRPGVLAYGSIRLYKDSLGFLFSGPSRCVTSALGTHTLKGHRTQHGASKEHRARS